MSDTDAYREVFLAESADFLQQIVDGLLELESRPTDSAPIEVLFRGAHSLKGMAAAMGYERTADLTHKMEGLMDRVRKDEMSPSHPLINLMLSAVDLVKDLIDDESAGGTAVDPAAMIAALESMTAAGDVPAEAATEPAQHVELDTTLESVLVGASRWKLTVHLDESCVLRAVRAYMVLKRLNHMGRVVDTVPSAREIEDEEFGSEFQALLDTADNAEQIRAAVLQVSEVESVEIEPVDASAPTALQPSGDIKAKPRTARLGEAQTVRVSIGHLDNLVDLVGELVILRSRLERIAESRADAELTETIDDLQSICTDLQYEVMQTRMVPVGNIFNRFPRMVRDLAIELGKRVEFEMDGLDIELDRTVLDDIGDPLVHLLRNSIDHGIESPEKRSAAGKGAVGLIKLSASRERDHVAITVSDDGKGIDTDRIWRKAVERGMVDDQARKEYSESDVLMFTCVPGFSTAEVATKVSGRGVGMDVVKGKIEHLGGTVEIRSVPGAGTEFVLRLPLTLAIIRALLVASRGQIFAVPLSAVEEVMSSEDLTLDTLDGVPVMIMRDGVVAPMHRLDAALFGCDPHALPEPHTSVVLIESGGEMHALHVDELVGRTEIVVKPLSQLFRDVRGFSGATVLGDGRVLLIIDPRSIFSLQEASR